MFGLENAYKNSTNNKVLLRLAGKRKKEEPGRADRQRVRRSSDMSISVIRVPAGMGKATQVDRSQISCSTLRPTARRVSQPMNQLTTPMLDLYPRSLAHDSLYIAANLLCILIFIDL